MNKAIFSFWANALNVIKITERKINLNFRAMEITLEQLQDLLQQQKDIVIDKLLNTSSYWNGENTPGHMKSINIETSKFIETGRRTPFPNDVEVLKKYLSGSAKV